MTATAIILLWLLAGLLACRAFALILDGDEPFKDDMAGAVTQSADCPAVFRRSPARERKE